MSGRRLRVAVAVAVLSGSVLFGVSGPVRAAPGPLLVQGEVGLVTVRLPGEGMLHELIAGGADVAGVPRGKPGEVLVDLVVSDAQLKALTARGATAVRVVQHQQDGTRRYLESVRAQQVSVATADTLFVKSAYWWTSKGQNFLQTLVATTAVSDPDVQITVSWRTADGTTGSFPLQRFEDAGEYQFHFAEPQPVPARPAQITATSSLGATVNATPAVWPGSTPPAPPTGYQKDFIDAYMTPIDIKARITRLVKQYPKLVDKIDLPYRTTGYRRTASAYVGDPSLAAIVVESVKFGDQNMNGFQVRTADPGLANQQLSSRIRDRVLTVWLATGPDGVPVSTTDEVAAYIQATYPAQFQAFVEDESSGMPMPVAGPARLTDGLIAPAGVPHQPWTVQALRIGAHRNGSRIGVLAYSQEHAREWATPLVTLEFAERLLANYATDPATRALLQQVEVFVVPTVNPDGANYSFYDFNFQRKNMTNRCTGSLRDPALRHSWGVDVNRNYAVGSLFDGYFGASTNCLSGIYAGTGENSEPESRNVIALARAHPNITFGMNVHSYGGYFMWPPGAYLVPGRITLPRPPIEEQALFQASATRIVGAIAAGRGTVTWPSRTGPVADVLYSAAGNSADQLYYENGVFAWDFEVGNDLWDPLYQQWYSVGFQPDFAEAHAESQEFADGLLELVRVARDYAAQNRR